MGPGYPPNSSSILRFEGRPFLRARLVQYFFKDGNPGSRFLFIQDGVVVDELGKRESTAQYSVVEASGMPVSATGFGLVRTEEFQTLVEALTSPRMSSSP